MKKNIFKQIFNGIAYGFNQTILFLEYLLLYIIVNPLFRCKVKGKKNIRKNDTKVFIANHYEIYGPVAMFLRFPFKFRPWVIDKIMEPESVEAQMSISIYNNFPKYPKWFKKIAIKFLKNLMVFTMKHAKAISVSRENPRKNIEAIKISSETLEKGTSIAIFPELSYVTSGVGKFQSGFEHIAKYHYQKTGKCISFYPVFISEQNKEMYIEKPITYNPENDANEEKSRIVNSLYESMIDSYVKNECSVPYKKAKKIKVKRR